MKSIIGAVLLLSVFGLNAAVTKPNNPKLVRCEVETQGSFSDAYQVRAYFYMDTAGYVETRTATNDLNRDFDSRYDGEIIEMGFDDRGIYTVVVEYVQVFPSATNVVVRKFLFHADFTGGYVYKSENDVVEMQSCQAFWN